MSSEKDLPHDVVIEILSRLPVKTLLRFRCVCKSWYATITHPSFITTHLNRISSYNNHGYLQNSSFDPNEKSKWFETPFNCRPSYYLNLVGSVNGILCLVDERTYFGSRTVYLWNPSIRKFKILPSPSTIHHHSNRKNPVVFGFGFHRWSNDYKVHYNFYVVETREFEIREIGEEGRKR
ncbi:hypothetical protein L1049_007492 [Liquidambar formosana]|uniref:F-box domain-containing protein n=1 Tax=Liquidambar formosana TaxID=63359 RepID=A0AAP0S801_LIQFO